jgi:hypothetical protein
MYISDNNINQVIQTAVNYGKAFNMQKHDSILAIYFMTFKKFL